MSPPSYTSTLSSLDRYTSHLDTQSLRRDFLDVFKWRSEFLSPLHIIVRTNVSVSSFVCRQHFPRRHQDGYSSTCHDDCLYLSVIGDSTPAPCYRERGHKDLGDLRWAAMLLSDPPHATQNSLVLRMTSTRTCFSLNSPTSAFHHRANTTKSTMSLTGVEGIAAVRKSSPTAVPANLSNLLARVTPRAAETTSTLHHFQLWSSFKPCTRGSARRQIFVALQERQGASSPLPRNILPVRINPPSE